MKRLSRLLLCSFFILTGCQSYQTVPEPTIPAPIRIYLSPSTAYWQQAIYDCTEPIPEISILTEVKQTGQFQMGQTDWIIRAGEPTGDVAFSLGEDQVVLIVHPDNPITNIDQTKLSGIYTGFLDTWGEVQSDLPTDWINLKIQPMQYFKGDEFGLLFDSHIMQAEVPALSIITAPGPAEVIETVMTDPQTIGFIPVKWLISSVKSVPLDPKVAFPLTLSMHQEPTDIQKEFIACLQIKAKLTSQ